MGVLWDYRAWDDYVSWQVEDRRTLKRINQLIREIQRDPFSGIGKPEPLAGDRSGWWSRRIDEKHRIVYKVQGRDIIIAACKGHYE